METLLTSPVVTTLSFTLLHFLWQGVLIALVVKGLLLMLPQEKSQLRYLVALAGMAANLVAPLLTFYYLYQPHTNGQSAQQLSGLLPELSATFSSGQSYNSLSEVLPWLSLSWALCVSVLACKLLIDFFQVRQLKTQHVIEPEQAMALRFEQLTQLLKIKNKPKLLISLKARVPMAIGWIKPVVLLPASMVTGLSDEQLEMLLLHELAHVKRFDYLVNIVQTVIELLLFFHPCVKWVSKQIRIEREFCSDDIAIHHCGNPIAYAHTLTDTATLCRHNIPSMAMAASGGDLKMRVLRIVNHHCSSAQSSSSIYAASLLVLSLLATGVKQVMSLPLLDVTTASMQVFRSSDKPIVEPEQLFSSETAPTRNLAFNQLLTKAANDELRQTGESAEEQLLAKQDIAIDKTKIKTASTESKEEIHQRIDDENLVKVDLLSSTNAGKRTSSQKPKKQIDTKVNNSPIIAKNTQQAIQKANIGVNKQDSSAQQLIDNESTKLRINLAARQVVVDTIAKIEKSDSSISNSSVETPSYDTLAYRPTTSIDAEMDQLWQLQAANNDKVLAPEFNIKHKAAEVIKSYQPKYPEIAKRKGLESELKVTFIVDVDGKVKSLSFEGPNRHGLFKRAVRSAVKKWRFKPATKNGQPVESFMSKIFTFSLVS